MPSSSFWKGLVAACGALVGILVAKKVSDDHPAPPLGAIDDYAPLEKTVAGQCDLTSKPGVQAFRHYIIGLFGEKAGQPENILRDCSIGSPSEHWEGRAWDWTFPDQATAKKAVALILATDGAGNPHSLLRRAGIMYLIFNRQMWRAYPAPQGTRTWTAYTGPDPHDTHVHFSFSWAGARGETSLYKELREQGIA